MRASTARLVTQSSRKHDLSTGAGSRPEQPGRWRGRRGRARPRAKENFCGYGQGPPLTKGALTVRVRTCRRAHFEDVWSMLSVRPQQSCYKCADPSVGKPKPPATKEKTKPTPTKRRTLVLQRTPPRRPTERERTFANHVYDKGFISRICKNSDNTIIKRQINKFKKWAKGLNRQSAEEDTQMAPRHTGDGEGLGSSSHTAGAQNGAAARDAVWQGVKGETQVRPWEHPTARCSSRRTNLPPQKLVYEYSQQYDSCRSDMHLPRIGYNVARRTRNIQRQEEAPMHAACRGAGP